MEVMRYISAAKAEGRKLFAWLVDPEKAEAGPTPSLPTKGGGIIMRHIDGTSITARDTVGVSPVIATINTQHTARDTSGRPQ